MRAVAAFRLWGGVRLHAVIVEMEGSEREVVKIPPGFGINEIEVLCRQSPDGSVFIDADDVRHLTEIPCV